MDKELIALMFEELSETLSLVSEEDIVYLISEIDKAKRIFMAGAGRAGLMTKAFGMRLMHLGYAVNIIGETTTTSTTNEDLFIIVSGSGETISSIEWAKKAKSIGAKVIMISTNMLNTLAQIADKVIVLKAPTKREDLVVRSVQPMGNRFEQSVLLFGDMMVMKIMDIHDITMSEMRKRHTNIE